MPEKRSASSAVRVVVLSQFMTAFSWTYVYVFLPFYIQQVSPYDRATTLLWIGWILGITGAASTVFAPIWGAMSARVSPKRLYEAGMLLQTVLMGAMGFTESLPAFLVLRLLIGCVGGLSTTALIIVSATSAGERLTANVGLFQTALTSGQIAGPIAGAISADLLGYRATFVVGALFIFLAFLNVHFGLRPLPRFRPEAERRAPSARGLVSGWLVCFAATVQIVFLPSVLPEVLAAFGVAQTRAVRVAGAIVFAYGLAAALGALGLSRLAGFLGSRRAILVAVLGGSTLQALLGAGDSVLQFGLIRTLQVGLIAGVVPIVFADVAQRARGAAIGFMNTSRFVANAVGPLVATATFAHASPLTFYVGASLLTVGCLALFLRAPAASAASAPSKIA